jgi:peptidoglycan hydrolase-like protein with peptidoglycan-binding domain
MGDPLVLKAQQWVNKTYKDKHPDFFTVEENGKTGWDTVNALIRALQIELGIGSLANNFGPGTSREFERIANTLKIGGKYNKNIVKILQCGFWCKGYDAFDQNHFGDFTEFTEGAINKLQVDCGLANHPTEQTGRVNAMLMKAILDMKAFVRLTGGSNRIREIQRNLNRDYNEYFGLLACDGIYQRDTNQAIIYGLQAEMGMAVGYANGYFGVGTTAKCPTLSKMQGTAANIKLLQYSLYVNGEYTGLFDGKYSNEVEAAVIKFRKFMKIGNQNSGTADMPVIKALLSTTGDTERSAKGFDASTIMDQTMIDTVKSIGMSYAGRYLTGTVGVGSNRRPKNLTIPEAKLLLNNGINIVPIYQDNSAQLSDYTKEIGEVDGNAAFQRAFDLGLPADTIIYFAVDVDTTSDQIESHIIPYFQGINDALVKFGLKWDYFYTYRIGVYAPRNVCKILSDKKLASPNCYVSNMSSGFSANLGYPQPREWAFDQFYEPPYGVGSGTGHIYIDKVAVSGKDSGVNYIQPEMNQMKELLKELNLPSLTNLLNNGSILFGKEITVADLGAAKVTFKPTIGLSPKQGNQVFTISNGKIDAKFTQEIVKHFDATYTQSLKDGAESLSAKIKNGNISVAVGATSSGKVSYAVTVNVIDHEFEQGAGKVSFSFTFKIEIQKFFFDDNQLEVDWDFITALSVVAMTVIAIVLIYSGAMAGVGALIELFSMLLVH